MKKPLLLWVAMTAVIGLTSCSSVSLPSFIPGSNNKPSQHNTGTYNTALWEGSPVEIWDTLQPLSSSRLTALQASTNDPVKSAWIQLALISKRNSTNTQQLARDLVAWRAQNPSHPGNQLLPSDSTLNELQNLPPPQHIAILLPQHGDYASSGQAVKEGFLNAYYKNLPKVGNQSVKFYDTSTSQDMGALYQQAISDGADFVIGPLTKENVQQLVRSGSISTSTLALNYTDVGWSSLPTHFYEFGLMPEDELSQMVSRARSAGASRALIIAPNDSWGNRIVAAFTNHWESAGGSVQETWTYSANTNFSQDIPRLFHVNPSNTQTETDKTALAQQGRHDFNVILLFAKPQEAHTIVPLIRFYYANNVPIYASSSIYSGAPNPAKDVDFNGVVICDTPWNRQIAHASGAGTSPDRLNAVGQDSYLLSQTLPRLIHLQYFPIYGATGALTLSSNHQIHRHIPCTAIQNGLF